MRSEHFAVCFIDDVMKYRMLIPLIIGALALPCLYWFCSPGECLELASPLRIICGALFIFIMPGLVWGEVLGYVSNHALITLAISFVLTVFIGIMLLPIPFLFASSINVWIIMLFIVFYLGVAILCLQFFKGKRAQFVIPCVYPRRYQTIDIIFGAVFFMVMVLMAVIAYRCGENFFDIAGEKLLHASFARLYYSMPFVLNDLSVTPGFPPPHLVLLWEFIIAGWARLIHCDILPLFVRARFVIPPIGLAGMYVLIRNIFPDRRKAGFVFWCVLLMCFGKLMLISPSSLDWVRAIDPTRGAFSFMGTVHHGDVAMEVLIALSAGIMLIAWRNPTIKNLFLLCAVWAISFMWHPREFFQSGIYLGIFGIALFAVCWRRGVGGLFFRYAKVVFVYIFLSVVFMIMSLECTQRYDLGSKQIGEFDVKKVALKSVCMPENFTASGVRGLFNFRTSVICTDEKVLLSGMHFFDPKEGNYFLWLMLSALGVVLISIYGGRRDRFVALFFISTWFLLLSWNVSMLMCLFFTYSEILQTLPRMLYIFSYIIIAVGLYAVLERITQSGKRGVLLGPLFMLLAGSICVWWWYSGTPFVKPIGFVLSWLCVVSVLLILFPDIRRYLTIVGSPKVWRDDKTYCAILLAPALFFAPMLGCEYLETFKSLYEPNKNDVSWFSDRNPLRISYGLIRFLQGIAPKKVVLVDPLGTSVTSIYSPHYLACIPHVITSIKMNYAVIREAFNNKHFLFHTRYTAGDERWTKDHPSILKKIKQNKVAYILVTKKYYDLLLPYFLRYPEVYKICINDSFRGELMVEIINKD